jgi:succinate dehydrogenase/fumarate reductase iron-sulfur protein
VTSTGAVITGMDVVDPGHDTVTLDITCMTGDPDNGAAVKSALEALPGCTVDQVSDTTFLIHLGGKLEIASKVPLRNRADLARAYTPGVARICMAIYEDPALARNLTIKRNSVAVVTDGTAVLGLGDIGPEAAMPVMEGKAALFKRFADVDAWPIALDTKDVEVPEKEWRVAQEASDQIHKESLCILCGCCVSECNSMESDPEFLGPAALAKAYRFVGDARDQDTRERLRDLNGAHGIWDCTRCYFCNQRCPKHVDPRDAIAKLGAESFKEGFTRDEGAKHAKVFVDSTYKGGYLRETELVPKTIGPINAIKDIPFALQLARAGKVPNPLSPHKAKDNDEVKRLWKLLEKEAKGQPRRATAKHPDAVQGD